MTSQWTPGKHVLLANQRFDNLYDPLDSKLPNTIASDPNFSKPAKTPLRGLHSSSSFIRDQINRSSPQPRLPPSTFENEPDDCDLLPPLMSLASRFIRTMTAISERNSNANRRSVVEFSQMRDPLSSAPPYPWGTPPVDQVICALESSDLDAAEVIQQIKMHFPRLARVVITIDALHRRLMMLDQRLDNNYFKNAMSVSKTRQKLMVDGRDGIAPAHVRPSAMVFGSHKPVLHDILGNSSTSPQQQNHEEELYHDEIAAHQPHHREHAPMQQSSGDHSTRTSLDSLAGDYFEGFDEDHHADAFRLDLPDPLVRSNSSLGGDGQAEALGRLETIPDEDEKDDDADGGVSTAVKHGLAIHKSHGELWEQLGGENAVAGHRSIRRIDPNREEKARRKAVKHGLAIHGQHGEAWDLFKTGLSQVRNRRRSSRQPRESNELSDLGEIHSLPTPLKVDGEVVGIAPAGVLKSLGKIRGK